MASTLGCSNVEQLAHSQIAEWDGFVQTSEQACPFSRSEWLESFKEISPRHSYAIHVLRAADGSIEAGIALCLRSTPLGTINAVSPSLHQYVTVLTAPPHSQAVAKIARRNQIVGEVFSEYLQRLGYGTITLGNHPGFQDVRGFMWSSWKIVPAYTYLIDLSSFQGPSDFAHSHRKQYRKCSEASFKALCTGDLATHKDEFVSLYRKTYLRRGLDPDTYGAHAIPHYIDHLQSRGSGLYFSAKDSSGTTLAARIVIPSTSGTVYDWVAGTDPDHLQSGVTVFLIAEMFSELKKRSFKQFDFGGANTPGVADFKQGFNGALVHGFTTIWHSKSSIHRLARAAGTCLHFARGLLQRTR